MKTPTFDGARIRSLAPRGIVAALVAAALLPAAHGATIYSDLRDLAIPANFDGIYLDLDTGATNTTAFTGWDINPFFGGTAIGNSPAFQPVRISTNQLARVLNLAPGTIVSTSLTYASGFGGSGNASNEHLGPGADQFQVGTEGYLGFRFTNNASAGPLYGWMRVTLMNNAAGALIKDWAYDDAGGSIAIGRVQQSAPTSGTQLVTLSPATGENFALGSALSNTGGNTNSLLKTGAGTATLTAANTLTGATTVGGGTLELSRIGGPALGATTAVTVSNTATLLISRSEQVNNAAAVTLSGGTILRGSGVTETFGSLNLTAASTLNFGGGTAGNVAFGVYEMGTTPDFKLTVTNFSLGNTLVFGSNIGSYIASSSAGPYNGTYFSFDQGFATAWNGSTFTITAIPEASTLAAALGLLALVLFPALRVRLRKATGQRDPALAGFRSRVPLP